MLSARPAANDSDVWTDARFLALSPAVSNSSRRRSPTHFFQTMPVSRSLGRSLTREECRHRTEQTLDRFGLRKVRKSQAQHLSGGECRRLEIARCLVCEPRLILLDEPFTGIDPITIVEIQQIIRVMASDGLGVLFSDHNVREALKIVDRTYVIADGRLEAQGSAEEILHNQLVIEKYLGRSFAFDPSGVDGSDLPPRQRAPEPVPSPAVDLSNLAPQERMLARIEQLKTDLREVAERDLVEMGQLAVPVLLQALERPDVEIRRLAFQVLQRILGGAGHFNAYAPQAQRKQQIDRLREQFARRAVFVSYNHKDRATVDLLVTGLEQRGVTVKIDHRILRLGELWQSKLQGVVQSAGAALIVQSHHGMGAWQEIEIQACMDGNRQRGLRVVPLMLPGAASLAQFGPFVRQLHGFDLRNGITEALLDQLARGLEAPEQSQS